MIQLNKTELQPILNNIAQTGLFTQPVLCSFDGGDTVTQILLTWANVEHVFSIVGDPMTKAEFITFLATAFGGPIPLFQVSDIT